jgi:hypothetical protein
LLPSFPSVRFVFVAKRKKIPQAIKLEWSPISFAFSKGRDQSEHGKAFWGAAPGCYGRCTFGAKRMPRFSEVPAAWQGANRFSGFSGAVKKPLKPVTDACVGVLTTLGWRESCFQRWRLRTYNFLASAKGAGSCEPGASPQDSDRIVNER